jgi:hypothetical protein
MTPPVLYEVLHDLDKWACENISRLGDDPHEFYRRLEHFITYVVCRAHREGVRLVMKHVNEICEN